MDFSHFRMPMQPQEIPHQESCGSDSCRGALDLSSLRQASIQSTDMLYLLSSTLQSSLSLDQVAASSFEPYTDLELEKLSQVKRLMEITQGKNGNEDAEDITPHALALSSIHALCEAKSTCSVSIIEPTTTLAITDPCCGLCRDRISEHKANENKSMMISCGHTIAVDCVVKSYLKMKFCAWRLPEETDFIEAKKSSNQLHCQLCESSELNFEEVSKAVLPYVEQQMSKRPKFQCLICYVDDLDREEESVELFECVHIYCEHCLRSYIISRVNEQKFRYSDMHCPQEGCDKLIHNLTVDRLIKNPANMPIYNRMIRLQLINLQLGEKHIKVSSCPGFLKRNKVTQEESVLPSEFITRVRLGIAPSLKDDEEFVSCPAIFTFNEKTSKEYACSVCKYKSCLKGCEDSHSKDSIRGKDCKAYLKWKQLNSTLDKEVLAFFDKQTMCYCPKCKAIIIRNGGCNHMTCTMPQCGFEFCFRCQKPWICWRHLHYF